MSLSYRTLIPLVLVLIGLVGTGALASGMFELEDGKGRAIGEPLFDAGGGDSNFIIKAMYRTSDKAVFQITWKGAGEYQYLHVALLDENGGCSGTSCYIVSGLEPGEHSITVPLEPGTAKILFYATKTPEPASGPVIETVEVSSIPMLNTQVAVTPPPSSITGQAGKPIVFYITVANQGGDQVDIDLESTPGDIEFKPNHFLLCPGDTVRIECTIPGKPAGEYQYQIRVYATDSDGHHVLVATWEYVVPATIGMIAGGATGNNTLIIMSGIIILAPILLAMIVQGQGKTSKR